MLTTWASAGTAFMLGVAFTAGGFFVGLLFSMPRALAVGADIQAKVAPKADATEAPVATSVIPSERLYSINTNLEQVSDWLTKIIVGVGLVEAQRLAGFIWSAAMTLGAEFNQGQQSLDADNATGLALGMILGFPMLGFLIGFFSVRLYISRAIYAADTEILKPPTYTTATKKAVDEALKQQSAVPPGAEDQTHAFAPTSAPAAEPAVDAALSLPLDRLQTASDLATRGRAALLKGRFEEAVAAFTLALQKGGRDPVVLLDLARTLRRVKTTQWSHIIALLEDARAQDDDARMSPDLRRQIMWELLNAYLYLPMPAGFTSAIRLGQEYVTTREGRDDSFAYVYLAAAHGQEYEYYRSLEDADRKEDAANAVRSAIRAALGYSRKSGIEEGVRRWLQSLALSTSGDDDLHEVVTDRPELRSELGLDASSEQAKETEA